MWLVAIAEFNARPDDMVEGVLTKPLMASVQRGAVHRLKEVSDRPVSVLGELLRGLKDPINRYLTDVLVMADDPELRGARLALVQRVAALPDGMADLSQLQGF